MRDDAMDVLYSDRDLNSVEQKHLRLERPMHSLVATARNTAIMAGTLALATGISFWLRHLGIQEVNYIMTYILAVLLVANQTDGYIYGILSSVLGVLIFNYFFTEPYYTFRAYRPDYPVTFAMMLIAALITSTITAQAKNESRRVIMRERRIQMLYRIERHLIVAKSAPQVAAIAARDIASLLQASVFVGLADLAGTVVLRHVEGDDVFCNDSEQAIYREVLQSGMAAGRGTSLFPNGRAYYLPLSGQGGVLGVIGIAFQDRYILSASQLVFLDTVAAQVALVLERERLYDKQQETKLRVERERLRGDLLRAVSHDLRTPLTAIIGSTSTMLDNFNALDDQVKRQFVQGIHEDAAWLGNLVENILSMTRFDEGRMKIKRELEAVEEVVAGSVSRVRQRAKNRQISIDIPNELILVPMDGILIQQVLVNLLDNVPAGSSAVVAVRVQADSVVFEVRDNGSGIPEADLGHVFERFFTGQSRQSGRRGIGLGLAICKSIVEAHGGTIRAENNPTGGACLRFTLPMKGQNDEDKDTDC